MLSSDLISTRFFLILESRNIHAQPAWRGGGSVWLHQPSRVLGQSWALFKQLPVEAGSREALPGWALGVRVEWSLYELSSVYVCKRGKEKFSFGGRKEVSLGDS